MNFAARAALLGAIVLLSACGGGGAGDATGQAQAPAPEAPAPTAPVTEIPVKGSPLTGVVAVGAPLAGATVDSLCANGDAGPSTTTDTGGGYALRMPDACATPWLLRARGSGEDLYSFGGEKEVPGVPPVRPTVLNITPLTDLLTMQVVEIAPTFMRRLEHLRNFKDQWRTIDPTLRLVDLQKLRDRINQLLADGGPPLTLDDILYGAFQPKPGDRMDDLLEHFRHQQGGVPTEALLEQLADQGGNLASGRPWKTLFGSRTSLSFTGTGCQYGGNPAADVAVTLHMEDEKNLRVELAWSAFEGSRTFTVGPASRSDFQMGLKGSSAYVNVAASRQGGHRIELFTQAGVPMIHFASAHLGATCTLANPLRRADLAGFHPAARILSVVPAEGMAGSCPATQAGGEYAYEITRLGDVRVNGASLAPDWLDAPHAAYTEWLQYGMNGPGPSYQVLVAPLPTGQALQPYYFRTVPYAMYCTRVTP